ncbi:MATE family efflux transporter [Micromonospora craniellae]|nr:MATE family efflux transporter [Micromonospora craniellae]
MMPADQADLIESETSGFRERFAESWRVTWPIIAGGLTTLALSVVDTAIVGQYSTEALATMSLVLPVYVLGSALILPWATAVQVHVSRWKGAGDTARISRVLDVGAVLCLTVGLAITVVVAVLAPLIVSVIAHGDPPAEAAAVLRILAASFPLIALTAHFRGVFGGIGETKTAMRVVMLVSLVNIPLDYALVFGLDLGAVGSAWGTFTASLMGAVYITVQARRRLSDRYPFWRPTHLHRSAGMGGSLWRMGWPDLVFSVLAYGSEVVLVVLVATLGQQPLAGYRLMVITVTVLWAVIFGASSGIAILVGQRLGAGDLPGAHAYRRSGAVVMAALAVIVVAAPLLAPGVVFHGFTDDPAVVAEARNVVYALIAIVPAMIVAMTLAGVLRAAGDTRGLMYIGVLSQVVVAMPLAYLCVTYTDLGLAGVYVGFATGLWVRAGLTLWRYRTGRWARSAIEGAAES